jgi:ornithine cyclodeaminase
MKVLVADAAEVERLLPPDACIEAMAEVLGALARGEALQPLRTMVRPATAPGLMAVMPSWRGGTQAAFGVKVVGVFHGNAEQGLEAHQGAVLLFSGETGQTLAVLNASAVTAIRTAAVSAVATRVLARPDAGDLAIVGSGVQAGSHLEALACVRRLRRVRVASRDPKRARAFVSRHAGRFEFPIEAAASAEDAVRGADLVVTATTSAVPVVRREWLSAGAHLNVVGASLPDRREVDGSTVAASSLFVDRRESAENESGDYLLALREGAIREGHIRAELGDVLAGRHPGRASAAEITLFKSLGLAVEDLAAAALVHRRARTEGSGRWVDL